MEKNRKMISDSWMATLIVVAILLIDQTIKIWVKTNMTLHETISVTDWFKICFIENNGMAWGMEIGSKLVLSLFRIVAVGFIAKYICSQVSKGAKLGYVICLSMVLAGAAGNIFDSMFYGLIFNGSSQYYTSYFVPFGTGYAPFLMGKVVDMFYFPLVVTTWPGWMPMIGGEQFVFFSPVFNFADACISVGVMLLVFFYRRELSEISLSKKEETVKADDSEK